MMPKRKKSNMNILRACALGDCNSLNSIIKSNTGVHIRDNYDYTALHHAVRSRELKCINIILDISNIDIRAESYEGCTALMLACMDEEVPIEIVEAMLKKDPVLVEYVNNEEESPLHIAVANKRLDIVQLLCKYGASVNYRDLDEEAPLHICARNPSADIVEYLLYGTDCDVNAVNDNNKTALEIFCYLHFDEEDEDEVQKSVKMLLDFSFDVDYPSDDVQEFLEAVVYNMSPKVVHLILDKFYSVNNEKKYFIEFIDMPKIEHFESVRSYKILMHEKFNTINDMSFSDSLFDSVSGGILKNLQVGGSFVTILSEIM